MWCVEWLEKRRNGRASVLLQGASCVTRREVEFRIGGGDGRDGRSTTKTFFYFCSCHVFGILFMTSLATKEQKQRLQLSSIGSGPIGVAGGSARAAVWRETLGSCCGLQVSVNQAGPG